MKGSKNRPAVVLWTNNLDVIVCFITSELKWQEENDIALTPNEINGLKVLTLSRVNKIATFDVSLVFGILGYLSVGQINKLNDSLIKILQLRKTYK